MNLTDGLDGLCAGSSMIAFVGYAIIAMWQMYHLKGQAHSGFTYAVSDPLDLGIIACCAAVACLSFLWYNCNPASIFMGDTGSWHWAACSPHSRSSPTRSSSPWSSAVCSWWRL